MSKLEIRKINLPKAARDHQELHDLDAVVDVEVMVEQYRAHDVHALDVADLRVDLGVGHQRLI